MVTYSDANSKLKKLYDKPYLRRWLRGRKVYSLDLLSGWSCPFADECKSKAIVVNGKRRIQDGPKCKFRCFSASQEVQYDHVYNRRKANFDAVRHAKTKARIVKLLLDSLPADAGIVRYHVAGDFFSLAYFEAAIEVAKRRPDVLFYAYTKAVGYWIKNLERIPANMVLTASVGGLFDEAIETFGLRYARVVFSTYEARKLGLVLDNDDSHAADPSRRDRSFGLLIHGTQPKGTKAAKIVSKRR